MSHREDLRWLAPQAPPCFPTRAMWLAFLESAADNKRNTVLVFEAGKPVQFNRQFKFCSDCQPEYRAQMREQSRCVPHWLLQREAADAT